MSEVIELPKHVARAAPDDAWQWPEPLEVRPVTRGACDCLPRPALRDQRLAFRQAADRYIGGEGRSRIAALETVQIVGGFDRTLPQRLAVTAPPRCPKGSREGRFWRRLS